MRERQRQRDQYRLQKAHLFNMIADLAVDMLSQKESKEHVSGDENEDIAPDHEDEAELPPRRGQSEQNPVPEPVPEEVNAVKESDVTAEIEEDSPDD